MAIKYWLLITKHFLYLILNFLPTVISFIALFNWILQIIWNRRKYVYFYKFLNDCISSFIFKIPSFQHCEFCSQLGATVGCCVRGCPANYHFYCARKDEAVLQEDRKVFCALHKENVDARVSIWLCNIS